MIIWKSPSSSGNGEYQSMLADDGLLSCNCRGYYIKREGKPKECRHVKDFVKEHGLVTEVRDGLLYVIDGNVEHKVEPPTEELEYKDRHKQAHDLGYVNPMLASALTGAKTPEEIWKALKKFQDGNWSGEIKYDGNRVILSKLNDRILMWSRPRPGEGDLGLPRRIPPHWVEALKKLPDGGYDGEEVIGGTDGKSYDVKALKNEGKQKLVLFDMIRDGVTDIKMKPYLQRSSMLCAALYDLPQGGPIGGSELVTISQQSIQSLWDHGAEGVILKRKDGRYVPGRRTPDWVKIKAIFSEVGVVVGYENGENGPYSKLKLVTALGIETTVKTKNNLWLRKFKENPDAYVGLELVFTHYGPTPPSKKEPLGKFRGPIIWDHWKGEAE